ncbi:MAG: hypothetical protein R3E65_12810 [Steroidobacteraceae bacterium]
MTRISSLLVALLAAIAAAPASAELVVVDGAVQLRPADIETPRRGMRMNDVEARFGAPESRTPAVGEPPISRWDYAGFTVYFERDIVLHAVVRGS